jgi:hypothetical protein
MKLLLATHKAFVLWEDGATTVLHTGDGVYHGITWSPSILYVVARGHHPGRVRAFDVNMWPLEDEDPPFEHMGTPGYYSGPHQAFWWDGALYVANTQHNRIEVWRGDEVTQLSWNTADGDIDHVNSIWRDPGSGLFYVVEHRKMLRPKRIRVLSPELELMRTIEFDLDCLVERSTHCGLHNVYIEDGTLFTLGPSQLILIDGRSEPVEVELPGIVRYKHYLRGFARTKSAFFIGVSEASPGEGRPYGESRVLVVDDRFDPIGEIVLDKRFGQLMEIRVLDEQDFAHNGIPCPLEMARNA